MLLGMVAPVEQVQYEQNVSKHIYNTTVRTKFYVSIKMPSGHVTKIPVINGFLPYISSHTNNRGRVYRLNLDYSPSKRTAYDPAVHKGVIQFYDKSKTPVKTPIKDPVKEEDQTPKPVPIIIDPGNQVEKPVNENNRKGSSPRSGDELDQEIDDLFKSLKDDKLKVKLEDNQKPKLVRPSDIKDPVRGITPTYE
jgi:hypothetical protein